MVEALVKGSTQPTKAQNQNKSIFACNAYADLDVFETVT
jgi:hypothetical protein